MSTHNYWMNNIKKVNREAKKLLKLYNAAVAKHPGISLPRQFDQRVLAGIPHYTGFLAFHPGGRANMFNGLMPILAIMASVHTVLRNSGWTVDQIARINYETFYAFFMRIPGPFPNLVRNFMVSPWFVRFMRKPCTKMNNSGLEETFELEYSYSRKPEASTNMSCTKCGMISFMKRAQMTEMFTYCNIFDFAQADAIGLGLVQPKCIGAGDPVCAYRFTRNPADTRYPAALRRILATAMEM